MKHAVTVIAIIILLTCTIIAPIQAENRGELYPLLTVVMGYDYLSDSDEWIIHTVSRTGEENDFIGEEEDAHIGNLFNLLIYHDIVMDAYYEGELNVHQINDFFYKWR